jgi:hypothetical protein
MTDEAPVTSKAPTILERAEGAEKLFLSGRRHHEADLASAVRFFLEFLQAFESFEMTQPCVTVFGSSRFGDGEAGTFSFFTAAKRRMSPASYAASLDSSALGLAAAVAGCS